MSSNLTDDEVGLLYRNASGDRRQAWERELRARARRELIRKLPSPTGRCTAHNHRVVLDDKGAYSSGYPYHVSEDGRALPGYCEDFPGIVWDAPSEEKQAMLALLEVLR